MNIGELRVMLETARQLGYDDTTELAIDDSRDGSNSFPAAKARFVTVSDDDGEDEVILAFGYAP